MKGLRGGYEWEGVGVGMNGKGSGWVWMGRGRGGYEWEGVVVGMNGKGSGWVWMGRGRGGYEWEGVGVGGGGGGALGIGRNRSALPYVGRRRQARSTAAVSAEKGRPSAAAARYPRRWQERRRDEWRAISRPSCSKPDYADPGLTSLYGLLGQQTMWELRKTTLSSGPGCECGIS